ncbi:TetR family transcriptional regulator [Pseudosulfitobacter sp. SM2401]|uniref:TetR/AcrR family transcriptional regulator n=1 Tax=Pseudosulfitobacter sp. SM2401 TaxID=3350098 RepID=UPI0036F2C7D5
MNTLQIRTETAPKPRLGRADWLRAAMSCLMEDGIDAVQVTRLATSIGASRGSFYWHFKSRQELLDGLLGEWFAVNGQRIKAVLDQVDSLDRGVLSFFAIWTNSDNFNSQLEQAVRDWARLDDRVLGVVRAEDTNRIAVIAALFQRFDYQQQEAEVRARVLYFAQVGYFAMNPDEVMEERMSMLDDYFFAFTGRALDADTGSSFRRDWIAFS